VRAAGTGCTIVMGEPPPDGNVRIRDGVRGRWNYVLRGEGEPSLAAGAGAGADRGARDQAVPGIVYRTAAGDCTPPSRR